MTKLKLDLVCQVALVVRDLEKALETFQALTEVEEGSVSFSDSLALIREGKLSPQSYQGVEGEYAYRQVNFFMGGMDIEIFAPVDEQPGNPVVDFLNEHGPGIHHLNIRMANREEGLRYLKEELQITPLMEGSFLGRQFQYFDLRQLLGITFEVGMRVVGPRAAMPPEALEALLRE